MNKDRIEAILNSLRGNFPDGTIRIKDESHLHAGHAGAKSGKGHFSLEIVTKEFTGHGMVQRHKMVYSALGELMQSDIHALRIHARTPDETKVSEKNSA